jgi:hypothetical protein
MKFVVEIYGELVHELWNFGGKYTILTLVAFDGFA